MQFRIAGRRGRAFSFWAAGLLALALSGCAATGPFVWYTELPKTEWGGPPGEYVIGAGDVVNIRVYEQENLSASGKIRRDGKIALPLVGEIMVVGKQPSALARELEAKLKTFVVTPRVTVNIETAQPITVNTMGEFTNKGTLTLEPPANMLQAMAQSGGPNEFADDTRIFVVRQYPRFQRIRFTYEAIMSNENGAATFPLRTGDVLVIE